MKTGSTISSPSYLAAGKPQSTANGFALIATISVMVLLVMIAIAMLSLTTIEMRTTTHNRAQAEAEANARLSLILAINQLQKEMGPDRRISAPAGILDSSPDTADYDGVSNPHYTGVWAAAESGLSDGMLHAPSYDKESGFRTWLVSGDPTNLSQREFVKTPIPTGPDSQVMLAAGTAPTNNRSVIVPVIEGENGRHAWWTSENGTKATIRANKPFDEASEGESLLAFRRFSAGGHTVLDPRFPPPADELDGKLVGLAAVDVAVPNNNVESRVSQQNIHDFTTLSEMVPVDVTTGRLRQCINLKLNWLQGLSPDQQDAAGTLGNLINNDPKKDYRICSWDQLRNYESLSREDSMMTLSSDGRPTIRAHKQTGFQNTDGEREWNPTIIHDRYRIQPVLQKLAFVVSYATEKMRTPPNPAEPEKTYALRLYLYPMAVLWNPYNVDLIVPEYCLYGYCPLDFAIGEEGTPDYVHVDMSRTETATMLGFGPAMGGEEKMKDLVIPAGSTKVLYAQPVRWETHPNEHRNRRFPWHYYQWAQSHTFNLGDTNYGGVVKNLNSAGSGYSSTANFNSVPQHELVGAATDLLKIEVSPSSAGYIYSYGMYGAHTEWWGSNGPPESTALDVQKFGGTSHVAYKVERNGPQISLLDSDEIPHRTFASISNKPTPLLYYECYRKPADEDLFPSKQYSFNVSGNPIHGVVQYAPGTRRDTVTPWFENPYSFRFYSINSWFEATSYFQLPPDRDDQVYFGSSYSPQGQLSVIDQEIPVTPLTSLGQLQHLPLFDYRPVYDPSLKHSHTIWYNEDYSFHEGRETQFAQNHAIGNSFASPGILPDKIEQEGWRYVFQIDAGINHLRRDRSYIANSVLWDGWFCSTLGAQDGLMLTSNGLAKRSSRQVAEDFFSGEKPLPNVAVTAHPEKNPGDLLDELFSSNGEPKEEAIDRIAAHLRISGGFNINSVSEEAWSHFLSGLFSRPQLIMESSTGKEKPKLVTPTEGKFLIARNTLGNAMPAERASGKTREDRYWNGSREIDAEQIRELAVAIVKQVKKRGPFLSLSEFVNRRLTSDTSLAVSGALQSALDDESVSINEPFRDQMITGNETTSKGKPVYPFPKAAQGPRHQGINGNVTQADLLNSVGPMISPRSDTFTIRAMGESRHDATGEILATAWCEAVLQRSSSYIDPSEPSWTAQEDLTQAVNLKFGRQFTIVSFRWLAPDETH